MARLTAALDADGFEYFVPPKITTLVFIRSTLKLIDDFKTFREAGLHLYYLRSRIDSQPIVVPDVQMSLFIKICQASEMPILMTEAPKVKLGDKVRVKEGTYAGLVGNVVRIKKQKRVLVNIADVIWATTAYISPDQLEVIVDPEVEGGVEGGPEGETKGGPEGGGQRDMKGDGEGDETVDMVVNEVGEKRDI